MNFLCFLDGQLQRFRVQWELFFPSVFPRGGFFHHITGGTFMLEKIFHLKENHTDVKTELMAGITTFMTMAYILAVNPSILSASGMDANAVLIATSLTIGLQIRHLISAPMGYNTADILDISTEIFLGKKQIAQFREELLREPCVEAVALGCGTPHDRGNNNTMQYGPDRMIGFQIFIGDSTYFRILGLERLRDNHLARMNDDNMVFINQHALRELGIAEDAEEFKVGMDYSYPYQIAGIYRDFQIGSALDKPQSAMLWQTDDIADMYPWNILVKIRGDKTAAYNRVKSVFERISDGAVFTGAEYIEQEIEADYADQRRILHIVGIFTLVAILISALGLVAMSTYYIQQKEQEVAVRKVFGSTRGEVLTRLVGNFMRLVGAAFVIAVPVAWYLLERWLQDYSVRISLSPLIFLASGAFAAVVAFVAVFWQSSRAADSNPIDSIKN